MNACTVPKRIHADVPSYRRRPSLPASSFGSADVEPLGAFFDDDDGALDEHEAEALKSVLWYISQTAHVHSDQLPSSVAQQVAFDLTFSCEEARPRPARQPEGGNLKERVTAALLHTKLPLIT
eukprot:Polyplicarium_translucidae@DN2157_c0_g1_i4.p2